MRSGEKPVALNFALVKYLRGNASAGQPFLELAGRGFRFKRRYGDEFHDV
jgi:hypothetical protein